MTDYHKDRISIQVGLSGYSFKVETDGTVRSSGWLSADRIFTSTEMQKRYDEVVEKCVAHGESYGLNESLVREVMDILHKESVRVES